MLPWQWFVPGAEEAKGMGCGKACGDTLDASGAGSASGHPGGTWVLPVGRNCWHVSPGRQGSVLRAWCPEPPGAQEVLLIIGSRALLALACHSSRRGKCT